MRMAASGSFQVSSFQPRRKNSSTIIWRGIALPLNSRSSSTTLSVLVTLSHQGRGRRQYFSPPSAAPNRTRRSRPNSLRRERPGLSRRGARAHRCSTSALDYSELDAAHRAPGSSPARQSHPDGVAGNLLCLAEAKQADEPDDASRRCASRAPCRSASSRSIAACSRKTASRSGTQQCGVAAARETGHERQGTGCRSSRQAELRTELSVKS